MMKVEFLENDSFEKAILIDYFKLELKEAKEMLNFDMELMEKIIYDNSNYSMSIEAEAKYMEEELRIARRTVDDLHLRVGLLTSEMQSLRDEMIRSAERELEKTIMSDYFQIELKKAKQLLVNIVSTEAEPKKLEEIQIPKEVETLMTEAEVAMLKSELHKSRARIAAAEAAEARALSVKYSLHLAVQELAVELEAAKKNLQILKTESDSSITISLEQYESLCRKAEMTDKMADSLPKTQSEDVKILKDGVENEPNFGMTISLEEYESLCSKSEILDKLATSQPRNDSQFLISGIPDDVKILKDEEEKEFGSGIITISLEEYESLCKKADMIDKKADSPITNASQYSGNSQDVEILRDETENDLCYEITTISLEEYKSLCQKAETASEYQIISSANSQEVNILQEELEIANAEIDALRFAAEEAVRRAERAEEAKAAVEGQLRRWRQKQLERRAASQQHHEGKRVGPPPDQTYVNQANVGNNSLQNVKVLNYVPLGKVLNMKF